MKLEFFILGIGILFFVVYSSTCLIDIKILLKKQFLKQDPPEPERKFIENDIKLKHLKEELINRVLRNNAIYMATESKTDYSDQLLNEMFFLNQILKKYK